MSNVCNIDIKGMHCRSCEILIEKELKKLPGVTHVYVNHKTGVAAVSTNEPLYASQVNAALAKHGYSIGKEELPWLSKNIRDYTEVGMAFLMAMGLFFIAKSLGLINLSTHGSNYGNLFTVLAIGLTAGISTCMALVGGLVLGSAAQFARKHPHATGMQKFTPHLYFNLGRIGSYFLLGGVVGWLGSVFQLSTSLLGWLTVLVGIVMLTLGGQLIDIFPRLKQVSFTLPKGIADAFGIHKKNEEEYSHKNAMAAGAMTFFLPCGFTQAMQLYAMSIGSFWAGALTLGVFAIGTAPGLLGIGGLSSVVKGDGAKMFFKTAGVVVILLSLFNIKNGFNLAGGLPDVGKVFAVLVSKPGDTWDSIGTAKAQAAGETKDGVQTIEMTQSGSGYSPNTFTIKKGVPVRWIITSTDARTCAASLVSQQLGIRANLKEGKNVIEFTPKTAGKIRFMCSMGMFTGVFNVVEGDQAAAQTIQPTEPEPTQQPTKAAGCGGGGGKGGCGCGGGGSATQTTPTAGTTETVGSVQVLKASYSPDTDIQPNQFTVKAGVPVRLEVLAKENGQGCMGSLAVPELSQDIEGFTKGQTSTISFTPKTAGTYSITCGMGVPRGTITVLR